MNQQVRTLTDSGVAEFREYLQRLRNGEPLDPPEDLLTDPATSQPFGVSANVENRPFADRLEAARYLSEVFRNTRSADINGNTGLWSWLALFYFDQLCPADQDRRREPGKDWYYIPSDDWTAYYRHKLLGPFKIYERHSEEAHLLLRGNLAHPGEFNEQLASRQDFIESYGIVRAVDMLYFDFANNRRKRGAVPNTRTPGTLRRFIDVIQQLDLTYDLNDMSGEQILEILPSEFNDWKPRQG